MPMFNMGNIDILTMVSSDDPLYNLRQVEQILVNFPNYAWFDPMSYFPIGSPTNWGPLLPMIITIACLITGAATRPEIISVGLLIPPIMAMLVVVVMYFVGKIFGDWKTGVMSAAFTAVVSGQFFYRSFYGYMDHHIAEVLFFTIFCLFYMYTILVSKDIKIDLKDIHSYKKIILLSIITGVSYLIGLFVMPTIILFTMIVGTFTLIQFAIDVIKERSSEYLLLTNVIIYITVIIGLLIFGIKSPTIDLITYSIGHVYAYLGLIIGTIFLYGVARYAIKTKWYYYPVIIALSGIISTIILIIVSPQLYNLFVTSFIAFFGQQALSNTVQEARAWSIDNAWLTFNYGIILMIGGSLVMIYNNIRDEHPHQVFALVWSVIILFSTWQHVRYEYLLAVNVALLSAVCVCFIFEYGKSDIQRIIQSNNSEIVEEDKKNKKPKKNRRKNVNSTTNYLIISLVVIIIGISILFAYTSTSMNYTIASSGGMRMNPDWKESLEWMGNNTPDPGVDYYTIYNKDIFKYPSQSYGVMSWWDYGHLITYIAKRIPNANPFQLGVFGPDDKPTGAANYFIATSENEGNRVLDNAKSRYIVTDFEMDTTKFWAMTTWYNSTLANSPHQAVFFATTNNNPMTPTSYQVVTLNTQQYYLTMISRLHNFDGSLIIPSVAYYIEYTDPIVSQLALPLVNNVLTLNATDAINSAAVYNSKSMAGYHAGVFNQDITLPVEKVPALIHYRLVHESPSTAFNSGHNDIKYVKTFEYVKGAHIKGEGIIQVPIITNTGRNFIYQQESSNGEFIVPYSTINNPYGVKVTGKYKVVTTGKEYDVSESDIMSGLIIK